MYTYHIYREYRWVVLFILVESFGLFFTAWWLLNVPSMPEALFAFVPAIAGAFFGVVRWVGLRKDWVKSLGKKRWYSDKFFQIYAVMFAIVWFLISFWMLYEVLQEIDSVYTVWEFIWENVQNNLSRLCWMLAVWITYPIVALGHWIYRWRWT